MRNDEHARARGLIDAAAIEGIPSSDREWLDGHLESCAECSAFARVTDSAAGVVRLTTVALPPDLAARTQYRLRLRMDEAPRVRYRWALGISAGLSWVLGIASAPVVWRGFEWASRLTGLPPVWMKLAFGLWWAVPAALAAAIWTIENRKAEEQ
jgi:hypothetical protein